MMSIRAELLFVDASTKYAAINCKLGVALTVTQAPYTIKEHSQRVLTVYAQTICFWNMRGSPERRST